MEETKRKILLINLLKVLVGVLSFIYILFLFLSPEKEIKRLTAGSESDSLYLISSDEEMFSLVRQKSFLEARLKLSAHDSIGIVIDLGDSTLYLEMKGVRIHAVKASGIKNSRLLLSMNPVEYDMALKQPLKITKQRASIVKEPVTVIDAPRDTIDASENLFMPDTTIRESVNAVFRLERGIVIRLIDNRSKGVNSLIMGAGNRFAMVARNVASVARLNVPAYRPEIIIYLPPREIRTIYRALPQNAEVVLRLK